MKVRTIKENSPVEIISVLQHSIVEQKREAYYIFISQKILDKIFQPFFTTIPITIGTTGQGTGLGLSLAYDIVKAHGGELKVQTKEGESSEFIILLPAN